MPDFLFLANDPCLDFVNTEVVLAGERTDLLQNFRDFAEWLEKAGITSRGDAQRLTKRWAGSREANRILAAARELRRDLRSSAQEAQEQGHVRPLLGAVLTGHLRNPRLVTKVVFVKEKLQTASSWLLQEPADLIVPLAQLAATFFATADYSAIRKCENPECLLYFYDISKNHTRRWCSMNLCGNRAKVAAFRARG